MDRTMYGQDYNAQVLADADKAAKTFTGADIMAYFNHKPVGTLQAITVSCTREIQPIYSMNSAECKGFARGKRGIAGTLVFAQFDRDSLTQEIFWDDYFNPLNNRGNSYDFMKMEDSSNTFGLNGIAKVNTATGLVTTGGGANDISKEFQTMASLLQKRKRQYADQIPPFNITLTMVNDIEGAASVVTLQDVQLMNQGMGWSLDDITNEVAYTFLARKMTPLTSLTAFAN